MKMTKLMRRAVKREVYIQTPNEGLFRYAVHMPGKVWLTDNRKNAQEARRQFLKDNEARLNAAVSTLQNAGLVVYLKEKIRI